MPTHCPLGPAQMTTRREGQEWLTLWPTTRRLYRDAGEAETPIVRCKDAGQVDHRARRTGNEDAKALRAAYVLRRHSIGGEEAREEMESDNAQQHL